MVRAMDLERKLAVPERAIRKRDDPSRNTERTLSRPYRDLSTAIKKLGSLAPKQANVRGMVDRRVK